MQLNRAEIAEEAIHEAVDLHILHRELIEALALKLHTIRYEGLGYATSEDDELRLANIRDAGFDNLSKGGWRDIIEFPDAGEATHIETMESLIAVNGRFCRIDSKQELSILVAAVNAIDPQLGGLLLLPIAETAVEQSMKARGIRSAEHKAIRDHLDLDLCTEQNAIAALVIEKMRALLRE